jgi:hypothetical protein
VFSAFASNIVESARQQAVIAQVKAALMDRKDIRSRYIRVSYDGTTIQLAGFVKDHKQGEKVAGIAKRQEESAVVETFWSYEKDLEERAPYKTRLGEQAADAELWVKVRASLCGPDVRGILKNAEVQAVDVRHGKVRVFLILDGPPDDIDISPHVTTISGVKDFSSRTVKAYVGKNAKGVPEP